MYSRGLEEHSTFSHGCERKEWQTAQRRPCRTQTGWPWILDFYQHPPETVGLVASGESQESMWNFSREARWLLRPGHMPTPSALQLSGFHGVLSPLQNQTPPKKKGQANWSENLELTDLLTIIISFKPKISQIGKIKLFIAELYSILTNWIYDCEMKNHYICVYLPAKLWTI